jgi:[protein-PII] uridylyltransferase
MTEPSAPVARLLDELRSLDRAYSPGHHGRWSATRRSELVDVCLRELFGESSPPAGVALVALGGYGRGELVPRSDIDLLILHPGDRPEEVAALAERLLYPLWDAGLTVGHAVRTGDECLAVGAERLDAATAMLDGRVVAGGEGAWTLARSRLVAWAREDPRGFAWRLHQDAVERQERFGSVSSLLEPDLKEGSGGLRDVHALRWMAAAIADGLWDAALQTSGLLRKAERDALDAAEEFLFRVRSGLHLATGRATDRLFLDEQPALSRAMGFEDEPGLTGVDALMRGVFEHARQVEHVTGAVFDRYLRGGLDAGDVDPTPEGVMRAFAEAARTRAVMTAATLDRIDAVELPVEVAWSDDTRRAFLEIVRAGPDGAKALETMDRVGLLAKFLPEWAPVRCRPQRDPYHRYSVDVHLLQTLGCMMRLLDGDDPDPLVAEASVLVKNRDAVLLGALVHDIGKTGTGDHVAAGVERASAMLDRMRVETPTRDVVLFLVGEHLLLSDIATRRDLGDDDLILDVAARVGDQDRLAALYLVTVADAEATGPLAWTPWRAALIRELVAKVQRVLERGEMGPETAERIAERADAVRALVGSEGGDDVDRFLARMPRGYLLAIPPEQAARHVSLLGPPLGMNDVRTQSALGTRPATYALTVVAADRPGLLSWIAGALSLAGLSILTAQVFTTEDGAAIDVFEVEGAFEAEVGEERWREFRTMLRRAIEGRVSLERRVEEKRAHYPPPRSDEPVSVGVHNDASDFFTVVEVAAPDRIGLLFDITRTLADLHLDVHLAKVATYGGRVVDVFYVRDMLGRKVEDAVRKEEVERVLAARAAPAQPLLT